MKYFLFFFCLLSYNYCFSQSITDVKGWRGTEWGMSVDSVQMLFKDEVTVLKKTNQYFKTYNPLRIENYEIGGFKYTVDFFFTEDTHKLYQVSIRETHGFEALNSIESILSEKYGKPSFKTEHPYYCKWGFAQTTIEINFMPEYSKIIIFYKKPDKGSQSKI